MTLTFYLYLLPLPFTFTFYLYLLPTTITLYLLPFTFNLYLLPLHFTFSFCSFRLWSNIVTIFRLELLHMYCSPDTWYIYTWSNAGKQTRQNCAASRKDTIKLVALPIVSKEAYFPRTLLPVINYSLVMFLINKEEATAVLCFILITFS